jgi:hypothetical protein
MRSLSTMALMLACGCSGGDATSETPIADNSPLTALFRDASSSTTNGRVTPPDPAGLEGLYFGELELVAWDYRPGEAIQALDTASGFIGAGGVAPGDWSVWLPLPSGYEAARNYVLQRGQALDFGELLDDDQRRVLPADYTAAVGAFEIDVFEVFLYRTGVVYDNALYASTAGTTANSGEGHTALYRYPQWDGIAEYPVLPSFPSATSGVSSGADAVSVLFVRDDWFGAPVTIELDTDAYATDRVIATSRTLSTAERGYVDSLLLHGTSRRLAMRLFVVPFDGPVSIDLTAASTDTDATDTDDATGFTPVVAGSSISAANLRIAVDFDLAALLADGTSFDTSGGVQPELIYAADSRGIPMGLNLSFLSTP